MPLTRAQKEEQVQFLNERFANDEIVIVTQNLGLTVSEVTELRTRLRELGASFKVPKNTLAKRALQGTQYEQIEDLFSGPVGIATSADPVGAAKATQEFSKDHKKFVIIGGAMGNVKLDPAAVEQLSKLPSLDELRSKIIGLIQAPATKVATVIQAPVTKVARVFAAYGETGN
jgi:large subunit ribosomal protein L10